METDDSPFGISRRAAICRLGAATLAGVLASRAALGAHAQQVTPAAGVTREPLISDIPGLIGDLGQVPVARATFAPGAALPGEFLRGPLIALVETGTFDVSVGEGTTPAQVGAGGRVDVLDWSAVIATNTGETEGSWLILGVANEAMGPNTWFAGPAWRPGEQSPSPGVTWQIPFKEVRPQVRFGRAQFSIARVTLAAGSKLESEILDGPTITREIWLLVEEGAVEGRPAWSVVSGATPVPEVGSAQEAVLGVGDVGRFDTAEAREVRAVGDEPAVMLLVRVADPSR